LNHFEKEDELMNNTTAIPTK